eukprot:TRINITY_DN5396_c3_g1_i1.p1 TRINITY_DN5396_c3_g1~~TRINITY_DN5396_c3_g1_i1.p1  ORF type:complete len:203 (+),score=55.78 TRINITY_DN5396_c3_g1_i1:66-611(+)
MTGDSAAKQPERVTFLGWANWRQYEPSRATQEKLDAAQDQAAEAAYGAGARAARWAEYTAGCIDGLPGSNTTGKLVTFAGAGSEGSVHGYKKCVEPDKQLDGTSTHGWAAQGLRAAAVVAPAGVTPRAPASAAATQSGEQRPAPLRPGEFPAPEAGDPTARLRRRHMADGAAATAPPASPY